MIRPVGDLAGLRSGPDLFLPHRVSTPDHAGSKNATLEISTQIGLPTSSYPLTCYSLRPPTCLNQPKQPKLTLPSPDLDAGTSVGGAGASQAVVQAQRRR
jgi:hypothetical protein